MTRLDDRFCTPTRGVTRPPINVPVRLPLCRLRVAGRGRLVNLPVVWR